MKLKHSKTQHISGLREKLGLSQTQLANQLCVSKAAISMAESGRRSLPGAALLKLLELEKKMTVIESNTFTEIPETNKDLPAAVTLEYSQLRLQQCEDQVRQLTHKLETMEALYKKLQGQLRLVETILEKEPDGSNLTLPIQRDRIFSKMSKCNSKEQALLRDKIALLNAEAGMHRNK